jgi:ATP/maltotriose-dependent transcriptional regulator MalT
MPPTSSLPPPSPLVTVSIADQSVTARSGSETARLLDRFSGPLIDEVCGVEDGTTWLARLAASNQSVISLDRTATWYRFHHLLRDVLRAEHERSSPERSAELHAAAGRWRAESGDLMSAVEHLLHAGCRVEAVDPGIVGPYLARVEARHGRADRPRVDVLVEQLTDRELSVLRYLPSALTQREIAGELFVSLNTVKSHCKAIYRKLGVDGRSAAVAAAREHALL